MKKFYNRISTSLTFYFCTHYFYLLIVLFQIRSCQRRKKMSSVLDTYRFNLETFAYRETSLHKEGVFTLLTRVGVYFGAGLGL